MNLEAFLGFRSKDYEQDSMIAEKNGYVFTINLFKGGEVLVYKSKKEGYYLKIIASIYDTEKPNLNQVVQHLNYLGFFNDELDKE
jgi:6-phosphogluconolactonase (cycloisomerase 2 family)